MVCGLFFRLLSGFQHWDQLVQGLRHHVLPVSRACSEIINSSNCFIRNGFGVTSLLIRCRRNFSAASSFLRQLLSIWHSRRLVVLECTSHFQNENVQRCSSNSNYRMSFSFFDCGFNFLSFCQGIRGLT